MSLLGPPSIILCHFSCNLLLEGTGLVSDGISCIGLPWFWLLLLHTAHGVLGHELLSLGAPIKRMQVNPTNNEEEGSVLSICSVYGNPKDFDE